VGTYHSIITCRNSETSIEDCILSIYNQTLKPSYILVIDDGSTDNTSRILKEMKDRLSNLFIITNPDLGYDITRVPFNYNKAISFIKNNQLESTDYHMIASDDAIYERDYADKIIKFMDKNRNHVFASGNYDNNKYTAPRGSGRIVRTSYFDEFYEYYPEKMGYETAIIHTADMLGYNYAVLDNARFEHTRGLGTQHHFYDWGASMKALGYHPLFVLNRFLISFVSGKPMGRLGAISMLYYYISSRPKEEGYFSKYDKDLIDFIRKNQVAQLRRIRFRRTSRFVKGFVVKILNHMLTSK
jgi:glycosyltransferase involved in cell wall biosynthesis